MQLETGIFVFMIAFSFGFMIWGLIRLASPFTYLLRVISIVMFLGLSLFVGSGYEISATTSQTNTSTYESINPLSGAIVPLNSTDTITTKEVFIPEGTEGSWLSYIFLGFAILNMALVVKDVWR